MILKSSDYMKLIPIPDRDDINTGLTPASHSTMLRIFGRPGALSKDCSPVTNLALKKHMGTMAITPHWSSTGFLPFLTLLKEAMDEIKPHHPNLYSIVTSAGCLCVRAVRGSTTHYSNHSWGCAQDLVIGGILAPLNATRIPQGLMNLYPYFHKRGIFWAAGYKGRTDPMHLEASNEKIKSWDLSGLI